MPLYRIKNALPKAIAIFAAVMLTACVIRPPESAETRSLIPAEAVAISEQALATTTVDRIDGKLSILALSGGGADGAYGVGVLSGWTQTGTRPEFDIVTGVSTGALMSVLAFLGPKYDDLLKVLYLSSNGSDIFLERGLTRFFSDSLYDNTPLKELIEKHMTERVLMEVAAEHAKGRRLYVATTNLDSSELVVWDMGLLASGGAEGRADSLQLFQKVLRASAAIPVFFPPVYIKPKRGVQLRQAHVDGGVKAPVLVSDFLFAGSAKNRELYIIINGSLALVNHYTAVRPDLKNIAVVSVGSLTSELTQQVVYRGYVRAQNSKTKFHLTAIPDDIIPLDDPLKFDQRHLQTIYKRGFQAVQKPGFWLRKPPTVRRFDRVVNQ